jgi:hypothetical protein
MRPFHIEDRFILSVDIQSYLCVPQMCRHELLSHASVRRMSLDDRNDFVVELEST